MIDGKRKTFGVSGKLYNSTVVLYDRETESLWSQIQKEAITGPLTGKKLQVVPSLFTSWGHWKTLYPDTLVLSPEGTGFPFKYNRNPYRAYYANDRLVHEVPKNKGAFIKNKERVIGIEINGVQKAYRFSKLAKATKKVPHIEDEIGGQKIRVHFDRKTRTASITDENGRMLPAMNVFWFAWQAFHPKTLIF